jgi:hypothetical protein
MFERLRRAMVDSFVGAIGLGYLFAQGIMHFVSIFASPVAHWVSRYELHELMPSNAASPAFRFRYALPELIDFLLLMSVWYVLLRWLYFTPPKTDGGERVPPPADLNTTETQR